MTGVIVKDTVGSDRKERWEGQGGSVGKGKFDEVPDQRGEANEEGRKYIWWLKRLIRKDWLRAAKWGRLIYAAPEYESRESIIKRVGNNSVRLFEIWNAS